MISLFQIIQEILSEEKADRCLRIARTVYDKSSAYRSGAIERCRQGDIWKDIKEEEQLDEVRQGLLSYLKQKLPNTPEYVIKDLIYKSIKAANDNESAQEWKSWIDKYFLNLKWESKTNFPITMDIFNDKTQNKLRERIGGKIQKDVDKDIERHKTQQDLLKSQGISKEPIILFKTKNGKYELAEGWHRTIQAFKMYPEGFIQPNVHIGLNASWVNEILTEKQKETLDKWFKRQGAPGKEGGWVDCNTCRDGKCKSCGRKTGEERAKYPSCRPTPEACKDKGKGKDWGKTK